MTVFAGCFDCQVRIDDRQKLLQATNVFYDICSGGFWASLIEVCIGDDVPEITLFGKCIVWACSNILIAQA
jgi:hypothetical protein